MNERDLQKKCLQYARNRGCFARKVETPSHNGFPDCIFHHGGKTMYVEFKSPTGRGKLSPVQIADHQRLNAVGLCVYVIDSSDKFYDMLGKWMTGGSPFHYESARQLD